MKPLTTIPQIDKLLQAPSIQPYIDQISRPLVTRIIRQQVEHYRQQLLHSADVDLRELQSQIDTALQRQLRLRLQPVINATGIMIHTNLGRAPLCPDIWRQAGETVCRYTNLELDLSSGKRGQRMGLLPELLQALCGAPDSLVVNNNAAALHLILCALAAGKEVLVSRGEQVQIGGGFRIPEMITCSGARLRDVGTTNITTVDDYLQAITPDTAVVLIVHPSNYYISGFTATPDFSELAAALPPEVLLVVDQGSGNQQQGLAGEHSVAYYLQNGADLVCFSTDKLLGSSQGGIIAGSAALIQRIAKHPLMRTARPGKIIYALLEAQLIRQLNQQDRSQQRLIEIATQPLSWHLQRAQHLFATLPEGMEIIEAECLIGGGTTPRKRFPTYAICLPATRSCASWLTLLRQATPPVIAVAQQQQALLFPVSLLDEELPQVAALLHMLMVEPRLG